MDENKNIQPEEFQDQDFRDTFGDGAEFQKAFEREEAEPLRMDTPAASGAAEVKSVKKGRPARKKGYGFLGIPHILATVVWLAIILWVGVSMGRILWVCATDVLAFGREEQVISFTVEETDTLDDIAQNLKEAGLIRYPVIFKAYGTLTDAREDISAGTFNLNTIYDYMALVNHMSSHSSSREVVKVTIPEGYNCEQMFQLLEEKGVCKAEYLREYAASGELDSYWFLEGVQRGTPNCLEGFLFPDTYQFYLGDSAANVIEKLLDGFDYRFSEDHRAAIDTLNVKLAAMMKENGYGDDYIATQYYDVRKILIVASLIEEETANSDESYKIASVIYNRLTNQKEHPYLNIDATLMYVLGHKDALTAEDLTFDSPYNTNINKGLIPGPITNPGLNSINAALNPDNTNYYYYVLDTKAESRQHHFSETYDDHVNFINSLKEG